MKYAIYFICLVGCLACAKSDNVAPINALVGTWRLTQYCKPTGQSTCDNVTVPSDRGVFITFDNQGQFNEYYENTKPIEYAFLGCGSGHYALEGNQVRIKAMCMSSTNGRLIKLASVGNRELRLNPFDSGDYIFEKL